MMKGVMVDENLSVLTCASGEITASSGTRNETTDPLYSHHSSASTNQPPPSSKKKRNLPGNPDPDAEVIALSPKTLMATNRFICEICNKGFQRDQNLQLHRRGHNLPWKLKQRGNKEVRKKVYVCPESTCVHNHPSRALGDLTGIKKHFCRKHGEKKWKCEKCSKRYAVQSDWKAHSKICGTREYRCDCGTLFSRRDSFITHRAFCDALAQESTAVTSSAMAAMNNPLLSSQPRLHNSALFPSVHPFPVKREDDRLFTLTPQVPAWLAPQTPSLMDSASCNNNNMAAINPSVVSSFSATAATLDNAQSLMLQQNPNPTSAASMSAATALLPRAAGQMASSGSPFYATLQPHATSQNTAIGFGLMGSAASIPLFASCPAWELTYPAETLLNTTFNGCHGLSSSLDQNKAASCRKTSSDQTPETPPPPLFHHMMTFEEASFEEALNGILLNRATRDGNKGGGGGGETRDFLGLRALTRPDHIFQNGINDMNSPSTFGMHQNHTQTTFWRD